MANANKYQLCVAAMSGKTYIAAIGKDKLMTDDRRILEPAEVLSFIHQWAKAESKRTNSNEIFITGNGKKLVKIELLEADEQRTEDSSTEKERV